MIAYFFTNRKRYFKKKIILNSYINQKKKYIYFSNDKINPIKEREFSFFLPGYPLLESKNIVPVNNQTITENNKVGFFNELNLNFGNFLFYKKRHLKIHNSTKKKASNPYLLYSFNYFMKSGFDYSKSKFTKHSFNEEKFIENKKINKLGDKSFISSKCINQISSFPRIYFYFLIFFFLTIKKKSFTVLAWNFSLVYVVVLFILVLVKNKKIFIKNQYNNQKNLPKILEGFLINSSIFLNGIFRTINILTN